MSSADFFQNQHFRKILSGIPLECQTVLIKIRPYIFSVCKSYQHTTQVGIELNGKNNKTTRIFL